MNTQELEQALHSMEFAVRHLREALKRADGVAGLVLLPMIAESVALGQRIEALLLAAKDRESQPATHSNIHINEGKSDAK